MKKIILFLILLIGVFKIHAQINFEGAAEYGRLDYITFDPNIENRMYALSVGNHVMISEDKGITWDVLYTFPYSIVILRDLKYREDHTLSFLVQNTVNEDGVYILDIETNSIIRQYIPPIPAESYKDWIQSYSIFPNNSDVALCLQYYMNEAGMAFSRVYRTNDGGVTWHEVYYNVNFDTVMPNTVAIAPDNPEKFFLARGPGAMNVHGGVLISDDNGDTWSEKLSGITLMPITFAPDNPNTLWIGSSGSGVQEEQLYKSIDGGINWELVDIPWSSSNTNSIDAITYNPGNLENIMVLERNEISITQDGGLTWENYVYPEHQPELYNAGIYASFNPYDINEVIITSGWYPMISNDGGISLSLFPNIFHRNTMVGLFPQNENHLYYSLQNGLVHIEKTTGEVESFDIENIDLFNADKLVRYYTDSRNFGRIFSFVNDMMGAFLYVSDEHGDNKELLYQSFFEDVRALSPDPVMADKVWVSFRDEGLVTLDFTDINDVVKNVINLPEPGIVYEIFFDATPGKVWIALNEKLFVSLDDGNNWTESGTGINLGLEEIVFKISQNPFNSLEMVVAASNGIYRTSNGGVSWDKVFTGINVQNIAYSPVTNGQLVASIYTRDIAEARVVFSSDGGQTWTAVPFESIYNTMSFSMDYFFHDNSVDVYIATEDLGVLKLNVELNALGIEDLDKDSGIAVYPNPTKDVIYFEALHKHIETVELYDTNGKLVGNYKKPDHISLAGLQQGIYFLKIQCEKSIYLKRVVKD